LIGKWWKYEFFPSNPYDASQLFECKFDIDKPAVILGFVELTT
jgi:hypothetical protein